MAFCGWCLSNITGIKSTFNVITTDQMPDYIAPRLRCGLGNRLFQTVAAITAAERTGATPVFLLPRMSHLDHGNFNTLLTLFPQIKILESAAEWEEVQEDGFQLIPHIPDSRIVVLSGFFQNSENFPKSSQHLPRLPRLPHLPHLPHPSNPTWAIHFRFGDYTFLEHYHVDLSKYYFYTITKFIPKGSSILLFSDTPSRLHPIADEIKSMGYHVTIYDNSDTLATLHAFAACQSGSICSNSTFSWWAAYFSAVDAISTTYKAYFPSRWMKHSTPNLFTLPFTQSICLDSINASSKLKTFSHY